MVGLVLKYQGLSSSIVILDVLTVHWLCYVLSMALCMSLFGCKKFIIFQRKWIVQPKNNKSEIN